MNEDSNLKSQLTHLVKRVEKLEQVIYHGARATSVQPEKRVKLEPKKPNAFLMWLKDDWLMKLGAFLLILAMGWFVTYAFINNWIGPVGRIALGIIVGAMIMVAGHLVIPNRRAPGQVLTVTGGVMVLITFFAARSMYDFFTPATAMGMMFLVVVAMATIAILHRTKSVAIMALLGGALVPILVSSGSRDYIALLSYVFILDLGVLAVVAMRGWRSLIFLALIVTGLYSFVFDSMSDPAVWTFMAMFFGLFFVSNAAAIARTKKATVADLLTTGLNGLILLMWVSAFVPDEWKSIILSAVVLLLVGMSYFLLQITQLTNSLYLHSGLAVLFLGAATAFELEGAALTIAFSIEAFVIVALGAFALKKPKATHAVSIVQVLPALLAFESLNMRRWRGYGEFEPSLFNQHFFVILIVALSLAGTAWMLMRLKDEHHRMRLKTLHAVAAAFFFLALIWLSSHNIFESVNVARGVALVIYTLFGVGMVFQGAKLHEKALRYAGGGLLGLVVLRLLFVEVWGMSLSARIVTFVAIGVLLITTAFFQKRIK